VAVERVVFSHYETNNTLLNTVGNTKSKFRTTTVISPFTTVQIKWWCYDCCVVMVTVSELSAKVQLIFAGIHTAQFTACFHTMVWSTGVA